VIGTIHGHRLKRQALQLLHDHLPPKRRNRAPPTEETRVCGTANHTITSILKKVKISGVWIYFNTNTQIVIALF
jgi:hypothetical protein